MLLVVVIAIFQVRGPRTEEAPVYRGDPNATILIVDNPELRANEIVAGVNAVTTDGVRMTRLKGGHLCSPSRIPLAFKTI